MSTSPTSNPPVPQILRLPEVQARVGLSKACIYLQIKTGQFPAPLKLGHRASGWLAHEVDAWIAARIAARTAAV